MSPVLLLAVFGVAFAAAGAAVFFARRLANIRTNADHSREPEADAADWMTPLDGSILLKEEVLSTISFWDQVLAKVNGVEMLKARIAEAGLNWSVGRVTLAILLGGAASWAVLSRFPWVPGYAALAGGALAGAAPYLAILRRRSKRLLAFEQHFPDALDSLARALRAGHSLAAGLDLLAREARQPVAFELRKTVEERNLGLDWDLALEHLAQRVPVQEVQVFVAAVQLQNRTGGKLHEVLAKLAENMREGTSLKGEVRAIAAHGRMTGTLLTVLPVIIALLMLYVNPAHMAQLWVHPAGKHLTLAAIGCLVAAHLVIRKLVDIKI